MSYRGHADWRDMSDYVVHSTKDGAGITAFESMRSILATGRIEARSAFGFATGVNGLDLTQHCACFSEIPLDMLDRLVARRSNYGIGFHQDTLIPKGAGRVWYLDQGTSQLAAMQSMVTLAMTGGVDQADPVWRITPFADSTAPNYHFEWEREWRLPNSLSFIPDDVAFLFLPEHLHSAAAEFLSSGGGGAGPSYHCPILDPLWTDSQVQAALHNLAPPRL